MLHCIPVQLPVALDDYDLRHIFPGDPGDGIGNTALVSPATVIVFPGFRVHGDADVIFRAEYPPMPCFLTVDDQRVFARSIRFRGEPADQRRVQGRIQLFPGNQFAGCVIPVEHLSQERVLVSPAEERIQMHRVLQVFQCVPGHLTVRGNTVE